MAFTRSRLCAAYGMLCFCASRAARYAAVQEAARARTSAAVRGAGKLRSIEAAAEAIPPPSAQAAALVRRAFPAVVAALHVPAHHQEVRASVTYSRTGGLLGEGVVVDAVGAAAALESTPLQVNPIATSVSRGSNKPLRPGTLRGSFGGLGIAPPHGPTASAIMARLGMRDFSSLVRYASTVAAALPPFQPTNIFVKVGDDNDYLRLRDVDWAALKDMEKVQLLGTIAGSKTFGPGLKDVWRGGCEVGVVSAPTVPDVLTEATKASVVGTLMTLSDATTAGKCSGDRLFIHVRLPGAVPMGLHVLRHPSATTELAIAAMHPQWQDVAARLMGHRARMRSSGVLHRNKPTITGAEASTLGLSVLDKDDTGVVRLGVFNMPAVPEDVMHHPKGLSLANDQQWFHLQQRADICHEFLGGMVGKRTPTLPSFGLLLSGPNGADKSTIGAETALTSFARGLVCIYIPNARVWVTAAEEGHGNSFLLERLLRQNADLIAAHPDLRKALAPALVLEIAAVGKMDAIAAGNVMNALRTALDANPSLNVGIVVDEVQSITAAIRSGMQQKAAKPHQVAADYFKDWHDWDNVNRRFVRMDIASNHGLRELSLKSGDRLRLRFVMPWTADLVSAATKAKQSPCGFPDHHESARQRIVYAAGGFPRSIFQGKVILDETLAAGHSLEAATALAEDTIKYDMQDTCSRWFDDLGNAERQKAAAKLMLRLVRGQVEWNAVKGLYDSGIVALYDRTHFFVKPVSSVAASVVMAQLAPHFRKGEFTPLSQVANRIVRGFELENQVIALLADDNDGQNMHLDAKTLQGNESAPKVPVYVGERVLFGTAAEVTGHPATARLYVPSDDQFSCDAITFPAGSAAATEPIVVWETSITSPHDPERVAKVLTWFRPPGTKTVNGARVLPAGIITALQAAHPGRPIVCALCWPYAFEDAGGKYAKQLTTAAVAASSSGAEVRIAVVDREGLQQLGVLA